MIKAVLFDMDGTLLPMDLEIFIREYFKTLAGRVIPLGYDKDSLIEGIWKGMGAMVDNDGSRTNEEAFWDEFSSVCGERVFEDKASFDEFYERYFDDARSCCGFDESAAECVREAKEAGFKIVLATNPVFPKIAQIKRAVWAGVDPELFDHVTSYENCRFCKPRLGYYLDVASAIGVDPRECLMIGNDVGEDMVVSELGMDTFLVTPCLINRVGADISAYRKGDLSAARDYIKSILKD